MMTEDSLFWMVSDILMYQMKNKDLDISPNGRGSAIRNNPIFEVFYILLKTKASK